MEVLFDSVIKLFRVNELECFPFVTVLGLCLLPCAKSFELHCAEQYFNARQQKATTGPFVGVFHRATLLSKDFARPTWPLFARDGALTLRPPMTSSPWRLGLIRPQITLLFSNLACQKQQKSCCRGISRPAVHSAAQFVVRVPIQTTGHH